MSCRGGAVPPGRLGAGDVNSTSPMTSPMGARLSGGSGTGEHALGIQRPRKDPTESLLSDEGGEEQTADTCEVAEVASGGADRTEDGSGGGVARTVGRCSWTLQSSRSSQGSGTDTEGGGAPDGPMAEQFSALRHEVQAVGAAQQALSDAQRTLAHEVGGAQRRVEAKLDHLTREITPLLHRLAVALAIAPGVDSERAAGSMTVQQPLHSLLINAAEAPCDVDALPTTELPP